MARPAIPICVANFPPTCYSKKQLEEDSQRAGSLHRVIHLEDFFPPLFTTCILLYFLRDTHGSPYSKTHLNRDAGQVLVSLWMRVLSLAVVQEPLCAQARTILFVYLTVCISVLRIFSKEFCAA